MRWKANGMTILMMSIKKIGRLQPEKSCKMFGRIQIGSAFLHDLDSLKHTMRFLRLQSADFYFIDIIRIVIPLAFQRHILNCSTAKTRDVTGKTVRAVKNDEQKLCCVRGWRAGEVVVEGHQFIVCRICDVTCGGKIRKK